jgi:hypothetical protein
MGERAAKRLSIRRARDGVGAGPLSQERLAFVLHDVFGVSSEEIGQLVERTPTARGSAPAMRRVAFRPPDHSQMPMLQSRGASSTRSWPRPAVRKPPPARPPVTAQAADA